MFRAVRAFVVPRVVRATGVALRNLVVVRAAVVGLVARAVTDWVGVRVWAFVLGVTVFVAVRAATFFVAVRGSVVVGVVVRTFVPPERDVFVLFDFCD